MNFSKGLIAGIALLIGFVLVSGWWLLMPSWVALIPGNGEGSSKDRIVQSLLEWQVDYKIDEATNEILVNKNDVRAVRDKLAQLGIPEHDGAGLEMFNESEYGLSEFIQNINYQRAIEVELARTIRSLEGIKNARVHLSLPKESLFRDRQREAKASVIIEVSDRDGIDSRKVAGIQQIVATAISELDPEQVSVVSHQGIPFMGGSDVPMGRNVTDLEQKYVFDLHNLILGILPEAAIKVSVKVDLDLSKKKTIEEKLLPSTEDGQGFLTRTRTSNTKGATPSATERTSSGTSSSDERDYAFSKVRSEIAHATGTVQNINVGIVVSDIGDMPEDIETLIEDLVKSTLGLSAERGDTIKVIVLPGRVKTPTMDVLEDQSENRASSKPDFSAPRTIEGERKGWLLSYMDAHVMDILVLALVLILIALLVLIVFRRSHTNAKANTLNINDRDVLIANIRGWMSE